MVVPDEYRPTVGQRSFVSHGGVCQFPSDDSLSAVLRRIKPHPAVLQALMKRYVLALYSKSLFRSSLLLPIDFPSVMAVIPPRLVQGARTPNVPESQVQANKYTPFSQHFAQLCWSTNFFLLLWPFFGPHYACLLTKTVPVQSLPSGENGEQSVPRRKRNGFAPSTCV